MEIERKELEERGVTALKAAAQALYFDDSSDYKGALWKVVQALSPDLAKLLEENESKAIEVIMGMQSIADADGYSKIPEPRSYQPRWVCLEGMNRDELAAYDYGATSAEQAVKRILDGQDKGEGCANEPWESLRQRLLTLVVERHQHALNLAKAEKLLTELVSLVEKTTCTHEETHRGGAIWEICDGCGAKWADDEGGKPKFKWPKAVAEAMQFLEKKEG